MLSNKLFITVVGILLAIFAICNANGNTISEEFILGTSLKAMANAVKTNTNTGVSTSVLNQTKVGMAAAQAANVSFAGVSNVGVPLGSRGMSKGDNYVIPGTFSPMMSPRFSSLGYGAQISYNMPAEKYQGVPRNPLTFSNMARENFVVGGCKGGVGAGTGLVPAQAANLPYSGYTAGNWQDQVDKLASNSVVSSLPIATMSEFSPEGVPQEVYVSNTLMYGLSKSRLTALGDPIRGDLAIVPDCKSWFNVSVMPQRDLQQGALAVMGGGALDNNQASLAALQTQANMGFVAQGYGGNTTVGQPINMSSQKMGSAGVRDRTVQYSAFP